MRLKGYSPYSANSIYEASLNDFLDKTAVPLRAKIWAQKRGFLSDKIYLYGLTQENYRDYLSDFDYYKLHPINRRYTQWIDDKLTMKLILHPFSEFLPEYYYHIVDGEILKLMDCPGNFGSNISDIISLLMEKNNLAVKLYSGTAGIGFIKLHCENGNFSINNRPSSEEETIKFMDELLKSGTNYLITEYIQPHSELAKVWSKSANAVRIKILRNENREPVVFRPVVRFGTNWTGVIDNSSAGGVFCEINPLNGSYNGGISVIKNIERFAYHPDSKVRLQGQVPFWFWMLEIINKICDYLPQLDYMGFDFIVTEIGFKIIEINSLCSIEFGQIQEPIFTNEDTKAYFNKLLNAKR